jgi:hypothetical protein
MSYLALSLLGVKGMAKRYPQLRLAHYYAIVLVPLVVLFFLPNIGGFEVWVKPIFWGAGG